MLRFFRQIRQRLLTDNKFSKYLLYAVGEILLVVIGILIAIQVDNWNEDRKKEIEISQNLKELKSELESNLSGSYGILRFYNNRDSLIRQHLCNTISRDDIRSMRDLRREWNLITSWFVYPHDRVVMDKVLSEIENLPEELEHLKGTLRSLDAMYDEIQDDYEKYGEISQSELNYRAQHNTWDQQLWRWDRPFDEDLKIKMMDYLFTNPHYRNQLKTYWRWVSRAIVPDILTLRDELIFCLESISGYLDQSGNKKYLLPEELRIKNSELAGTYRNYRKFLNEGQQNLELGTYILFEEDGRLFSATRYDANQDRNYQSDQTEEWLVLDPQTVISPRGWFMHLVERDSANIALEYAGCNNRNFYLSKIE